MMRYKICPICGSRNDPTAIECVECEEDLINVVVVDEASEKAMQQKKEEQKENKKTEPKTKRIKICYCGEKNPSNARKCIKCGEDISTIIPQPDLSQSEKSFAFFSLDDTYSFPLKDGENLIGRDGGMKDYLYDKSYVSRIHALVIVEKGRVFIKNSGLNHTFVNNVMLEDNKTSEVKDGDIVSLGGNEKDGKKQSKAAYFKLGTQ